MKFLNKENFPLLIALFGFALLSFIFHNNVYFWDSIQQISKEAHWFYETNFHSLLMPTEHSGSEIVATGYHPPLMGIMTAILWKVFGYKIWVSHLFIFFWAILLVINVWKIIKFLFPDKYRTWVFFIILLEPTVLAQFAIASPDFILFTAFVISLRAVLERKPWLLTFGVFFLCCISMRGIFVGAILFFVDCYSNFQRSEKKPTLSSIGKTALPYLPTFLLLLSYFYYYLIERGWFFSNAVSNGHYSTPNSVGRIFLHFVEFGLRSVENGRILIWLLGLYFTYLGWKSKLVLSQYSKSFLLYFLLLTSLYLLFVCITQMPFSARYFLPQFFLLTILIILGLIKFLEGRKIIICFVLILFCELTGHLWIYPDKIAKSWDCSLAHLPYYELREKCFDYIDAQKLDYKDISGGFCLYGDRQFIELKNRGKKVNSDYSNCKYFIFSNISNVEDTFAETLKNKLLWNPLKSFQKGFIHITIYERNSNNKISVNEK